MRNQKIAEKLRDYKKRDNTFNCNDRSSENTIAQNGVVSSGYCVKSSLQQKYYLRHKKFSNNNQCSNKVVVIKKRPFRLIRVQKQEKILDEWIKLSQQILSDQNKYKKLPKHLLPEIEYILEILQCKINEQDKQNHLNHQRKLQYKKDFQKILQVREILSKKEPQIKQKSIIQIKENQQSVKNEGSRSKKQQIQFAGKSFHQPSRSFVQNAKSLSYERKSFFKVSTNNKINEREKKEIYDFIRTVEKSQSLKQFRSHTQKNSSFEMSRIPRKHGTANQYYSFQKQRKIAIENNLINSNEEDHKVSNSFSCMKKVLQEKSAPQKKVVDYTGNNKKIVKYLLEYAKKNKKRNLEASSANLQSTFQANKQQKQVIGDQNSKKDHKFDQKATTHKKSVQNKILHLETKGKQKIMKVSKKLKNSFAKSKQDIENGDIEQGIRLSNIQEPPQSSYSSIEDIDRHRTSSEVQRLLYKTFFMKDIHNFNKVPGNRQRNQPNKNRFRKSRLLSPKISGHPSLYEKYERASQKKNSSLSKSDFGKPQHPNSSLNYKLNKTANRYTHKKKQLSKLINQFDIENESLIKKKGIKRKFKKTEEQEGEEEVILNQINNDCQVEYSEAGIKEKDSKIRKKYFNIIKHSISGYEPENPKKPEQLDQLNQIINSLHTEFEQNLQSQIKITNQSSFCSLFWKKSKFASNNGMSEALCFQRPKFIETYFSKSKKNDNRFNDQNCHEIDKAKKFIREFNNLRQEGLDENRVWRDCYHRIWCS